MIRDVLEPPRVDGVSSGVMNETQHRENLKWQKWTTAGVGVYTLLTMLLVLLGWCSLNTSRDTEINQLKAYVYVTAPKWTPILPDAAFDATVTAKNGGDTPAYDVSMIGRARILPTKLDKPITSYESPELMNTVSAAFLFRDSVADLPVPMLDGSNRHTFTDDDLLSFNAGITRVYVWGRVTYEDAFHHSRYVNFCLRFSPASRDSGPEFCDQYNDADENQPRPPPRPLYTKAARPWHIP
jgi:hypothetical protein